MIKAKNIVERKKITPKLIEWRRQGVVERIPKPTRPARAHSLGYKAKQGFVVVRTRIVKGGRKRPKMTGGRDPKKSGRFFSMGKSKKLMAEEKASRKYPNMELLNSYYVGEDGKHLWYECILVDPSHPSVPKSKETRWITSGKHTGRVHRGRTSAGQKSRGLRKK
ncbi:MAG: 50S ribosomal protein L15e [Candidatus Aenigmarchaeota archaeon]|nr:50S ribosomal protein L15e [Candidatus Aenigmarchaeota archaeon]